MNIIVITLESIDELYLGLEKTFFILEIFFVILFTTEYFLRLWSYNAKPSDPRLTQKKRIRYIFSFYGIVDVLSILPFYLQILMPGVDLRILRAFRLVRILKISHYSSAIEDLMSAIYRERRPFFATLYIFAISILLTSTLMHFIEGPYQPEKFGSIPKSIYWSVITLTTVGYGDVTPVTGIGKVLSIITALTGICVVALLAGIVATAFSRQMEDRKLIFENEVRRALEDGILTEEEKSVLEGMRETFDIDEETESYIMEKVRKSKR
tara:strand:- start:1698 stop:2498 length:801 start_codon:yes stop_codon:yes gene_type:complete